MLRGLETLDINNIFTSQNISIGIFASIMANWLGGMDSILTLLLILMITDWFTTLYLSIANYNIKSKMEMFNGIVQKLFMLWLILLGVYIDKSLIITGNVINARNMLTSFFIGYEGLTVCENCDIIGVNLPSWIKDYFKSLKNNKGGDDKK